MIISIKAKLNEIKRTNIEQLHIKHKRNRTWWVWWRDGNLHNLTVVFDRLFYFRLGKGRKLAPQGLEIGEKLV